MTDLEMTNLCAQAMGYASIFYGSKRGPGAQPFDTIWVARHKDADHCIYQVLHGLFADSQAMALVKKLELNIAATRGTGVNWGCMSIGLDYDAYSDDLNRAIVECVAKMQVDRTAQETVARSEAK